MAENSIPNHSPGPNDTSGSDGSHRNEARTENISEGESISVEGILADSARAEAENAQFLHEPDGAVYRPDMPDWGAYLRWPDDGDSWICDQDIEMAKELLPSPRVFRRDHWDGEFYHLRYGQLILRVRPTMWTKVPPIDLSVDQQVEVLGRHGENDPGIFRVREIFYSATTQRCEFILGRRDLTLAKRFVRADLRPTSVKYHLRVDYYKHEKPKLQSSGEADMLDVGDILSD